MLYNALRVLIFSIISKSQTKINITISEMRSLLTAALIKTAISIALYFLAFLPMSYLPDVLRNNDYSVFFYLPTGVKVLCVLLFDIWGAVGLSIGVLIRQSIEHPEYGLNLPLMISLENAIVFWASVKLALKAMGVSSDIENITYLKIVGLALFCSVIHGFSYTFVLFEFNVISSGNYLRESLVTVMAGFFGTMATVLLLSFAIKHSSRLQRHMRAIEND